jgi:hypothetical protein
MTVKPIKFEETNLYRHPDFAPLPQPEQGMMKREPQRTPNRPNQVLRTRTEHLGESFSAEFDDEDDGNLFDNVDVTDGHSDDVSFDATAVSMDAAPKIMDVARSVNTPNGLPLARTSPVRHTGPPRPPPARIQGAPNGPGAAQQQRPNQAPGRPPVNGSVQRQPQTPLQQQNQARPEQNRGRMPPPVSENPAAPRPPVQQQQNAPQAPNNQPLRPTPPQAQTGSDPSRAGAQAPTTPAANAPPVMNSRPPVGFVTSRAAELLQNSEANTSLNHLPTFNPHAESPVPKDKRTPGVDPRKSAPVKRQTVGAPPAPEPVAQPANLSRTGGVSNTGGQARPSNFVNPHQDVNRRIGMPGATGYAVSPGGNRGAYRPPTFNNGAGVKRERPPLGDVSNQGAIGHGGSDGPDAKRQRVEAQGTENAAGVVGT